MAIAGGEAAVHHIVMWHLKPEALGRGWEENARELKARLEELRAVPGVEFLHVGIDRRRRGNSADVVLISRFRDQDALEAYHDHPLHRAILPLIDQIRERSIVVDFAEGIGPGSTDPSLAG
jgi:antibiotic biosynthesis monooxygenase (ABM) superfamily enzyme